VAGVGPEGAAPGTWACGRFAFLAGTPVVMGILNTTPDSFSNGGSYVDRDAALAAAYEMLAAGAQIIDVGGESTRPGSAEVSVAEETGRVLGVVRSLAEQGVCVSADTRHAEVAVACLENGASIINDIGGFTDPGMFEAAVGFDAGLVVMHMHGEPGTMQDAPVYGDVVAEVAAFLARQADALVAAGVAPARISLDPGLGFGKTTEHNLELLRRLEEIEALGFPVFVGASRKRFIGDITGVAEPRKRVAGSVAAALAAVEAGAAIVRVHDVDETVQALKVWRAIKGDRKAG
jgi:dihydropteroate synthase